METTGNIDYKNILAFLTIEQLSEIAFLNVLKIPINIATNEIIKRDLISKNINTLDKFKEAHSDNLKRLEQITQEIANLNEESEGILLVNNALLEMIQESSNIVTPTSIEVTPTSIEVTPTLIEVTTQSDFIPLDTDFFPQVKRPSTPPLPIAKRICPDPVSLCTSKTSMNTSSNKIQLSPNFSENKYGHIFYIKKEEEYAPYDIEIDVCTKKWNECYCKKSHWHTNIIKAWHRLPGRFCYNTRPWIKKTNGYPITCSNRYCNYIHIK